MATRNIVPRNDGEGKLGTATKRWGEVNADKLIVWGDDQSVIEIVWGDDQSVIEIKNASGTTLFVIDTVNAIIEAKSGVKFKGDGSLLTGVSGSVGHSSATDVTIEADTDNDGTGDIVFKIRSKEVFRIPNSYAQSLPTGITGNYILKIVDDNFNKEIKGGYLFDGNNYLEVADNINHQFTENSEFTLEALFMQTKLLAYGKASGIIGKYYKYGISIHSYDNRLFLGINGTVGKTNYIDNYHIELNKLHHVVFVYKGANSFYIVNGQVFNKDFSGSGLSDGSGVLSIGRYAIGGSNVNIPGIIYYTRVFNRALSQSEALQLYNNGLPQYAQLGYSDIGASNIQLITGDDSTFDSDTGFWIKGTGWTIANGKATATNAIETMQSNSFLKKGKRYRVKFTITDYSGTGDCGIPDGRFIDIQMIQGSDIRQSSIGTIEFEGTALTTLLEFYGQSTNIISIDDVTCYQVGCVIELKPENAGAMAWIESMNNLHAAIYGNPICLARNMDYKGGISTTTVQLVNSQPANSILKQVIVINNANAVNTISLGTTTNADEILNAVAVNALATKVINIGDSELSFASNDRSLFVKASTSSINVTLIYEKIGV